MSKKKVAVDCRELNRPKLHSLGLILLEVIPRLAMYYDVILLSDSKLSEQIMKKIGFDENKNYFMGSPAPGGISVFYYHRWIKKISKKLKFDILWQINHFMLFNLNPVKVITTVHDLFPLSKIDNISLTKRIVYWISLKISLKNSRHIITPSNFTKKSIIDTFKITSDRIHVIYNGVRECNGYENTSKLKIEGDFILYLGRLCRWKGTDKLLSVFNSMEFPKNYKLVLAGICEENIKNILNENLNRSNNLIFLDYVTEEDKEYLMRNTKLFIYPSRYDGFGIPPLEAGLRKIPVLMSDIKVLKEVTKNSGDYFDLNDSEERICSKIKRILERHCSENENCVEKMYRISQEYSWDNFALGLSKLIEKVGLDVKEGEEFEEITICS